MFVYIYVNICLRHPLLHNSAPHKSETKPAVEISGGSFRVHLRCTWGATGGYLGGTWRVSGGHLQGTWGAPGGTPGGAPEGCFYQTLLLSVCHCSLLTIILSNIKISMMHAIWLFYWLSGIATSYLAVPPAIWQCCQLSGSADSHMAVLPAIQQCCQLSGSAASYMAVE